MFDSFAALGIKAGSGSLTSEDLMRPGYIAGVGFEAALPLLDEAGEPHWPDRLLRQLHPDRGPDGRLGDHSRSAFFILAVQLFIAILEFKLTTLAGFVLVPFALWNKTARSWRSASWATSSPPASS
jgi:type IV secretion system protein TrbL